MSRASSNDTVEYGLGGIVRRRREQAGLSLREMARRAGISLSYLIAIENGRNPTTGRSPQPSPRVLAGIARALDLDMETLLAALGGADPSSATHLLLYQMGRVRSPLAASRRLFGGAADSWIDIVDPHDPTPAPPSAADDAWHVPGPLGVGPPERARFDAERALGALADVLADAPISFRTSRVGIVFGANPSAMRSTENPGSILEAESTWELDVAMRFHATLGRAPVANVCVYRDIDIQELAPRLDALATVVSLMRSHPQIAVEEDDGRVVVGAAAIETILSGVRPTGVNDATWDALVRAAASGFAAARSTPHAAAGTPPR